MGVPKKLTEMQMKFAHELVTNEGRLTATECAVNAGYEKDSAVVRAKSGTSSSLMSISRGRLEFCSLWAAFL
jgi:hypothetical protein